MNYQILTGTNRVARYVVKYIVKLDECNRITVWADAHTGAAIRVEKQFLHNTKIVTSKIYEEKAFKKSRKSKHPTGRAIAFVECMQHLLVIPEVMTTLKFEQICTTAFELRNTTKVKLSMKGRVIRSDRNNSDPNDVHSTTPPTQFVKRQMGLPTHRHFTYNQQMSY